MNKNERYLSKILDCSIEDLNSFEQEFKRSPLMKHLQREEQNIKEFAKKGTISSNPNIDLNAASLYYSLVRHIKPDTVVETGVANGVSSCAILYGIEQNRKGKLVSIDFPNYSTSEPGKIVPYLPGGKEAGWLVPEHLKQNWKLIIGDSKVLLPEILDELNDIDIFIHDSLHTYEHMLWECRTAWPHLKPHGFLIVDDADWNNAFDDFMREIKAGSGMFNKTALFGIAKKGRNK